jgi:hypothetical protein
MFYKIIVIVSVFFITVSYSQDINSISERIKSNYQPDLFEKDSFMIVTKFLLPGNFKSSFDYEAEISELDFKDYISYDTIYSFKKNDRYLTRFKKTTFIPETFGDEIDVWLNDLPDPLSADFYDNEQYFLLNEIAKNDGTEEFYGKRYLKLKINVNKLGHLTKRRDYYNRDFIKEISVYIDQNTYLIAGYSFEVILNPKSPLNMKHHILFSDYRKINGVLLPQTIKRYNVDFVKSAVTPELRNAFYDRIDNNIKLIDDNMSGCNKLLPELQSKCIDYWKKATQDFILMKEMINSDVFELNYEVIDVQ